MLLLILLAAAFAALFYLFGIRPMSYWKRRDVKQTGQVWVLGDNWRNIFKLESAPEMTRRIYDSFPGTRYCGMYQFVIPTLCLKDPDLIKQICVKDFDHFVDHRSLVPEDVDPMFGKNLFSLKGQRWREMRPILTPSFTGSKMKGIFVLTSECAENFVNYFLKMNKDIVDVEMKDAFTRYTSDVIATTAFGIKNDSLENRTNDFYMMGIEATNFGSFGKRMRFFGFLLFPKLLEILKIGLFDSSVRQFFGQLIENNIKERKEKNIVRPDVLNLLLEAQKKKENNVDQQSNKGDSALNEITNMDITAQAMIFFFAGFDGVSTIICFTMYELAVNPDVQKKLRKEIEETLENCGGKLTYEALMNMSYMDMVVSETLRKWTGPGVDRVCTKPYTIQPVLPDEKPLYLEKGTVLWLPIFGIHHDPKFYPEPDRFDPERFSEENKGKINPNAYIPFGVGPRNCIGNRFALMEMKIVVLHILNKFEVVPTSKTVIPIQISKKQINMAAEGGYPLGLKRLVK